MDNETYWLETNNTTWTLAELIEQYDLICLKKRSEEKVERCK